MVRQLTAEQYETDAVLVIHFNLNQQMCSNVLWNPDIGFEKRENGQSKYL